MATSGIRSRQILKVDGTMINPATDESVKAGTIYTTIGDGRKIVTTGGTAVALAASTECYKVDITAETSNTNEVVIGGSTVVAAEATRRGVPLDPGATLTLHIDNLAKVYVDAVTDTEGVTFTYYK